MVVQIILDFLNIQVSDEFTKSFSNGYHGHGFFESKASSIKQVSIEVAQLHGGDDGRLRLTCMATIPGYVSKDSNYADMRNSTIDSKQTDLFFCKINYYRTSIQYS